MQQKKIEQGEYQGKDERMNQWKFNNGCIRGNNNSVGVIFSSQMSVFMWTQLSWSKGLVIKYIFIFTFTI